mmetsp:Transcript_8664/g.20843  ORF Transcript_8664/g.20843 Transcript_8664/m.20843 type:complete len:269 (-) Transcript_8664:46-852(-)
MPTFREIRYHRVPISPATGAAESGEDSDSAAAAARVDEVCCALDEANRFIHEARSAPLGTFVVLVHSAVGWSRAAAVVSAYLLATTAGLPLSEALSRCEAGVLPAYRPIGGGVLSALAPHVSKALSSFEEQCHAQRKKVIEVVMEPGADVSREGLAATAAAVSAAATAAADAAAAATVAAAAIATTAAVDMGVGVAASTSMPLPVGVGANVSAAAVGKAEGGAEGGVEGDKSQPRRPRVQLQMQSVGEAAAQSDPAEGAEDGTSFSLN